MKAIVTEEYGTPDVLQYKEVDKPVPKGNEVLVKVNAASLNAGDLHILKGDSLIMRLMNGFRRPKHKILGDDVSGRIEAVGKNVEGFKPGDEVFGISNFGAFAEYACALADAMVLKPSGMTFEEAAAIPMAAISALQGLRDKGQIKPGKKVLIVGASGGVGTFAVQIAKHYGAEVTGVCSTSKLELVRSIGADHVIDYTEEDFSKSDRRYDLILAAGGDHPISMYRRALKPAGVYVCVGGSMRQYSQALIQGALLSMLGTKKLGAAFFDPKKKDYDFLIELFEAGKLIPVIDKRYRLSEVPEALKYLGEGRARGKVVILVANNNQS